MTLHSNRPSNEYVVSAYMADSGTSSSVYLTPTSKGYIKRVYAVLGATSVATSLNTLSLAVNGTTITTDSWTQPSATSAAGDVASANVTPNTYVVPGDKIVVSSDGNGSNTTPTMIHVVIENH